MGHFTRIWSNNFGSTRWCLLSCVCWCMHPITYISTVNSINMHIHVYVNMYIYIYIWYIYIHIYSDKSTSTWSVVFHAPKKCSSFGNIIPFFRLNISHVCLWIFVKVLQAASMESTPRPPLSSYRPCTSLVNAQLLIHVYFEIWDVCLCTLYIYMYAYSLLCQLGKFINTSIKNYLYDLH